MRKANGVYRSTRDFFTHVETSLIPVKGCNFDLCSARMAIEQGAKAIERVLKRAIPTVTRGIC